MFYRVFYCLVLTSMNWRQTRPRLLTAWCCLPSGQAPHATREVSLWSAHYTHSSRHHLTSLPGVYYWLQLEHLQSLRPHSTKVALTKSHCTKQEQPTSVWLQLVLVYVSISARHKVPELVFVHTLSLWLNDHCQYIACHGRWFLPLSSLLNNILSSCSCSLLLFHDIWPLCVWKMMVEQLKFEPLLFYKE